MGGDTGPRGETEADAASDADAAAEAAATAESTTRRRMESALDAVRREVLKAATVYAVVDAAALFLLANLLLAFVDPGWLPARVDVPAAVLDAIGVGEAAVPGSALVAAVVGLGAFVGELWYRTRRPLVEQFEAVNPPVAESLRTARDALEGGEASRMAVRLYEEVLAGLGESSSLDLVDWRRVGASLAVVLVVSLLTVQAAVVDVAVVERSPRGTNDSAGERDTNYSGLRSGDEVLGAAEAVRAGNETLSARVESSGGGREIDEGDQFAGDVGGGAGAGDGGGLDSQQAGFASPEEVEEADLVREYNRRIRENPETGDGGAAGEDDSGDDATG
jgi:hypothetical protein